MEVLMLVFNDLFLNMSILKMIDSMTMNMSAFYALSPFIGTFLSFLFLQEKLSQAYLIGLAIMIIGSALAVIDTLRYRHSECAGNYLRRRNRLTNQQCNDERTYARKNAF